MQNNSIKRLADNPHYAMSEAELKELADVLAEEAELEKKDRKEVKINKNRVKKDFVKLKKVPALEEVDQYGDTK